jgi:hypothetical protein
VRAINAFLIIVISSNLEASVLRARTVYLTDSRMEVIRITPGRSTILNFPSRPSKIILGNQGLFAVEYVENDLALAATKMAASSNLFVYLDGRRFAFDLHTTQGNGDEIVHVRDSDDQTVKVKIK